MSHQDGRHEPTHILLKMIYPVFDEFLIDDASDRARLLSRDSGGSRGRRRSSGDRRYDYHSYGGPTPAGWDAPPYDAPPPGPAYYGHYPAPHHYPRPHHGPLPTSGPPPPVYLINAATSSLAPIGQYSNGLPLQPLAHPAAIDALQHVRHNVVCRGCSRFIQGIRWLCAQCGTAPSYDLVRFLLLAIYTFVSCLQEAN